MSFTVAIVGRPNVGKSTLFNRLVGRRLAIVHDTPGVTRDRRQGPAQLLGLEFDVVDTAGFEDAHDGSIEARMRQQTDVAVAEADLVLLLIDARAGVTPLDRHFADYLRRQKTPVVVVANKCEGKAGEPGYYEAFALGLGDPIPVSAEHNEGLADLLDAIIPHAAKQGVYHPSDVEQPFPEPAIEAVPEPTGDEPEDEADPEPEIDDRPINIAVAGRPNVGKSTLINRLIGEDRLLVGPEAGLTRDAITVEWSHRGRRMRLVDTAGLRRQARIDDSLEKLSVSNTLEAIRHAEVVVLVMDAAAILDKQDLTIARMVIEEGRALVVAINKWDAVEDPQKALNRLGDRLMTSLPQAKGVATTTLSALSGKGVDRLLDVVLETHRIWNRRISTGRLNRWLEDATTDHPPPALAGGRRIKIRYATQAKARPPTFVLFASKPDALPESYSRYLVNSLRERFEIPGVPIRLFLRAGKNPYVDK